MIPTKKIKLLTALGVLSLIAIAGAFLAPPVAQDEGYHAFFDRRTLLGVPNFWNVISNLPFAAVGILGLRNARNLAERSLFAGVLLTCFGSAYYHLAPDDARLIWDRLPMTIVFMSFLACAFAQEGNETYNVLFLVASLLGGIASVWWWKATGDLRFYAFVQFGPMLILPFAPAGGVLARRYFGSILVFYVLAKIAEHYDGLAYRHFLVSGHTCKHLLAAFASYLILRWVSIPRSAPAGFWLSQGQADQLDESELSVS